MKRSLTCGICGSLKVERNNRLVCQVCNRRYAKEAIKRNGPYPYTESVKATKRNYRKKVRESGLTNARVYSLRHDSGIDEATFLRMFKEQNAQCAICQKHLTTVQAYVDHDHAIGIVRGLLCRSCNMGLGHFYDKPELLREAATYLEIWKEELREA